jgi:hypothetical protein
LTGGLRDVAADGGVGRRATPGLRRRLLAHWRLKLALLVGLSLLFVPAYAAASRHAWRPAWDPPASWLDDRVPYDPRWLAAYQSLYLLTGTVPWLAASRAALWRYVRGFAWLSGISLAAFLVFPAASPRPGDPSLSPAHALLLTPRSRRSTPGSSRTRWRSATGRSGEGCPWPWRWALVPGAS